MLTWIDDVLKLAASMCWFATALTAYYGVKKYVDTFDYYEVDEDDPSTDTMKVVKK